MLKRSLLVFACGVAAAMIVPAVCTPTAAQTTYTWDGSQTGSLADSSGAWNYTTYNWSTSPGPDVQWTDGNNAVFGAGVAGSGPPYTVTLGANVAPAGITFNDAGYVINPDASNLYSLTVGSNGVAANASATINAPVALGAAQTWTAAANQTLAVNGSVNNNGNLLALTGGGNTAISGALSGNGGVTLTGAGTATLSGALNYTGPTTVNNGTLVLSVNNNVNMPSAALSVASGAVLQIAYNGGNDAGFEAASITGGGTLQKTGTGNWVLGFDGGSPNSVSMGSGGLIDVEAGTLTTYWSNEIDWTHNLAGLNIASGATFNMNDGGNVMYVDALTGNGTLLNTGTLHIGVNNGSGTFSGAMNYWGSLVKHGTGTETLSGVSGYTGSTTIENGTLMVGANAPSGAAGRWATRGRPSLWATPRASAAT